MTIVRSLTNGGQVFWCPGCEDAHALNPGIWAYNGNPDKPTFSPSLLITSGHYVTGEAGKPCWCTFEARFGRPKPKSIKCGRCHSFVTDGRIKFLSDCTHFLVGQTVDLPQWPYAPGTYGGVQDPANAAS
jgi:Family of unknown function (DUF6527)